MNPQASPSADWCASQTPFDEQWLPKRHSREPGVQAAPWGFNRAQVFAPLVPTQKEGAAQSVDDVQGPDIAGTPQTPAVVVEPPRHFVPEAQRGPPGPSQDIPAPASATHCPGVDAELVIEMGPLHDAPGLHFGPSQVHVAPTSR
jgi:hypothetical protein